MTEEIQLAEKCKDISPLFKNKYDLILQSSTTIMTILAETFG